MGGGEGGERERERERETHAHLLTPLKMPKLQPHPPKHTHTFPHLQMHSIARCWATNTYRASRQQEVCCCQKSLGVFWNLSLAQRHADDGCHVSLRAKDVDGNPQRVPCKQHSPSPSQRQQQQQQQKEREKKQPIGSRFQLNQQCFQLQRDCFTIKQLRLIINTS